MMETSRQKGLAKSPLVPGKLGLIVKGHSPGQIRILIFYSVIIFGHDGEMDNEPGMQHPEWARNGSIQVVRRIKQFVPEWNE
jgi:hypothetical protein